MTLTLLALFMMPIYLKMVLDPKRTYKFMKHTYKDDNAQFALAAWTLLLALFILSSTGLNFAWEWESLLAWLGLLVGIKGLLRLIPGIMEKKLDWFSPERMPLFGFLGLVFALALIYIDTQVIG